MPVVFSRSVRSIEADGYRRSGLVFTGASLFLAAWAAWFVFARVPVVEVAESARLEVKQAAHSLEAPVAGRIVASKLELGREVTAGEVLVELDAEAMRLALDQAKARQSSFLPQLAALTQQIAAAERASEDHRRATHVRIDEANAHSREAESAATLAAGNTARTGRLRADGLASEADALKAHSDAEQKRAAAEGSHLAMALIESEQRASETERQAELARLGLELAQLEGQRDTGSATLKQLEYDIERRSIRAPVTGRLGDVATLHVGAVVKEGDKLGDVIPPGDVRIVGEFLPGGAIGRIQPGQVARMRPDGFSWTQYGMLAATVRRVANEPRSGHVRVELDVHADSACPIPLQHGLPGTLEIEIERVSPAVLVLRNAGSRLSAPTRAAEVRIVDGGLAETPADRP